MSSQMLGAVVLACAIWLVFAAALLGPRPFQPAGGRPGGLASTSDRPMDNRLIPARLQPASVVVGTK